MQGGTGRELPGNRRNQFFSRFGANLSLMLSQHSGLESVLGPHFVGPPLETPTPPGT